MLPATSSGSVGVLFIPILEFVVSTVITDVVPFDFVSLRAVVESVIGLIFSI
ncbi:MAG: hypothetical protein BWY68_00942 [bacterium ADurb.Bin400]|nr:MAG: hypothetical protein BWY68_00942 [bacterium ADurb.Bin400]